MFNIVPFENRRSDVYDPFRAMDEFERRFFGNGAMTEYKTDIVDEGDAYRLETELPGFDREDIKVDLDGETLTVTAEHSEEKKEERKKDKYLRSERTFSSYSRSFNVANVKTDEIDAEYKDGVLTLRLPKKDETVQARRLEIR